MKDDLKKIFTLCTLDQAIAECEARLADLPEELQQLVAQLEQDRRALAEKAERLAAVEKALRGRDEEARVMQDRAVELEKRLNQLKTHKEYQAGLKEIADSKKLAQDLAKTIEAERAEQAQLKQEVEALGPAAQTAEEKLTALREAEAEKHRETRERLATSQRERGALVGAVKPAILQMYERIRRSRSNAVVTVEQGVCRGCHMNIPPQMFLEIRKALRVYTCPSCHRILFVEEKAAASENDLSSGGPVV